MNLKITLLAFLLLSITSFSQTKLGTVNSDLIIGKMPQMQLVLKRVENYGKTLDSSFSIKSKEYQSKIDAYKAVEKTLSEADKKTKYQEIATMEQDMRLFRQNGTKIMQLRRDDYMRPLYKKFSETISKIARANGYTQILTTNGNQFGYTDMNFDITQLVLNDLGITE